MKEVTKEEFYKIINNNGLDVHPYPQGNFPYSCNWKFRNGISFGRKTPVISDKYNPDYKRFPYDGYGERYFIEERYFVADKIQPSGEI